MSENPKVSAFISTVAAKDATITTLRQQLAAAVRECEAWRKHGPAGPLVAKHYGVYDAMAATDRLIPDLAAVAKGGQ